MDSDTSAHSAWVPRGPSGPSAPSAQATGRDDDPAAVWRTKYLRARRRAQVLTLTTGLALVAAIGGVAWGWSQAGSADTTAAASRMPDGAFPDGVVPGEGPGAFGGPGGGLRGGARLDQLFAEDGSVDRDAVQEFLAQAPDGFDPTGLLERLLSRGALTQEQADALRAAFEAEGATGGEL